MNRLTRKADSRGRALSFTYDRVGNILTKTTYQGSKTSYVYNAANRLVMLQNPDYTQVDYQYDPAGRLLSRVTANGARLTQTFDANGWVTRLSQYDAANARISQTSYTRDRVGNITGRADGSGATAYTLDALYRLTAADYPGGADDELFTYDKVGNRKTYTKGALIANADTRYYNYASGSHRLAEIRIGSASGALESKFAHDFEGRLTGQTGVGAKALAWDAKGRVKSVGAETYVYDPLDYRIGRSGGALGTRDYFLEGEHLESEYSGGALKAKYFRGSSTDELVAAWLTDTDGKLKPYLYHHDPVNSVTALSGHNGRTTQATKYAAFGGVQSATGASPSRLKYTGREDDGAGLYYYRARYYDPTIGRFISEDPLGFGAGVNFYAYVGNNPVNYNDPSGQIIPAIAACAANPVCANVARAGISGIANVTIGGGVAFLTGRDYSWQQAGIDFAIGAGLSGLASGLAARQAANIRAAASVEQSGAIVGKAQVTGTAGHAERAMYEAMELSKANGGTTYLNRAMSTTTGIRTVPNVRPDALNIGSDGIVNMVEVASKTDVPSILMGRMGNAMSQLPSEMQGTMKVVESGLPSLYNLAIPAGGIIGYQGIGAATNGYAEPSASGGFLLYPNKLNTNFMQAVYSK
nr:RHS repeat-associated core domain-containing protein [Methylosinus sp. Sm6]